MPFPQRRRLLLHGRAVFPPSLYHLLDDEFTTAISAGALNNTAAEPGPGTRIIDDDNNKISIGNDVLSFASSAATNDGIWYEAIARSVGRLLVATITPSDTSGIANAGWDSNGSGAINDAIMFDASGVLKIVPNGGTAISVGTYTATSYQVAALMRATGMQWAIKGGAFTYWSLLWLTAAGTNNGQPAINAGNTTSIFTAAYIRVPTTSWLPTPLVSDNFFNYLMRDEFITTVAAGSLNGTAAESGPGTRTVTDTNTKISVAGGALSFATGAATNDGIWYAAITRTAGQILATTITPSDTSGIANAGWDSNGSGAINDAITFDASGVLKIVPNGGTAISVGTYTATSYQVVAMMRATGIQWAIKGGAFTTWTLLLLTAAGIGSGQPTINAGNTTSVFTAAYIRVQDVLWLPSPLVSDSFA